MNSKKNILIAFIFSTLFLLYLWLSSFDDYKIIEKLPEKIETEYIKNSDRDYFDRIRDSLNITFHSGMTGRYFNIGEIKTKKYWNVPIVLFIGPKQFIIGAGNSSFDDGLIYWLPFEYNYIDIYKSNNFELIETFLIDKYVKFACFSNDTLYLIFKNNEYGYIYNQEND